MEKLLSFFTGISDFLNKTSWFPLIKWPFWTLLVIVAFCGVYTARFGKKKLITLAFQCCMRLTLLYMLAAFVHYFKPGSFPELPFLSVTEKSLTLVHPLSLLGKWDFSLVYSIMRLYLLLFFINAAGSLLDYNPANPLSCIGFQALYCGIGYLAYRLLFFLLGLLCDGYANFILLFMAIFLTVVYALILILKFYFTFVVKGGNNTFQNVYRFLTENAFGKLFTISILAFLLLNGYLVIATLFGHSVLMFESFNKLAYFINCIFCCFTMYIFCRYFNG